ncbi:MAG: DUF1622 domain-containing protein [Clostridia bacterium]|nr:DUF1622 domain-containing protein [Clostridia bacterium]
MEFFHSVESSVQIAIRYAILFLECTGVLILLCAAGKSAIRYVRKDPEARLTLAHGIALALEFKLGGEVLRTVTVREWSELPVLGGIVLLRVALTMLIHWEINTEEIRMSQNDDWRDVNDKDEANDAA